MNSADIKNTTLRILCCAAVAGVALTGCSGGGRADPAVESPVPLPPPEGRSQQVGQENLAYMWPLTVHRGVMECRGDHQVVFTAPDGKEYALNDKAAEAGYASLDPIHATGTDGDKISLGSLRSKALRLCE